MILSRLVRLTALLLVPTLLSCSLASAARRPFDAGAAKAKIEERGVGRGVRVTLADKSESKGLIVSISDQSFALKVKGAGQPQEIQYALVTGVHKDKLSTGQKVTIGVVILGVAISIVAAVIANGLHSTL